MKVGEFMRLSQGTKSVKEYLHAFNNLARYAPEFVNTEAKKIASFQRGLSPNMLKTMGTGTRATFNAYISDCLTQENNNNNYSASKLNRGLLKPGRLSPGHQWQGDRIIVLLPQVLGFDHRREGTPDNQRSRSRTRWQ